MRACHGINGQTSFSRCLAASRSGFLLGNRGCGHLQRGHCPSFTYLARAIFINARLSASTTGTVVISSHGLWSGRTYNVTSMPSKLTQLSKKERDSASINYHRLCTALKTKHISLAVQLISVVCAHGSVCVCVCVCVCACVRACVFFMSSESVPSFQAKVAWRHAA